MKLLTVLNPCNTQNKLQQAIEWLTYGTECRCCIGARIVFAFITGLIIGHAI